ncbi:hypothetical protein D3C76_1677670 [compost metagenome]
MRQRLTPDDYAAMAVAADELAGISVGIRKEMNKALSERYRALSVRGSVAAEKRVDVGAMETTSGMEISV